MAESAKCFIVRNSGEYGSFYLREGVTGEGDRKSHWCELTCNTAFGVVGHYWGSMGVPAARFLSEVNKSYLIDKLWGMEATVFDVDEAVKGMCKLVIKERRSGDLTSKEAREYWDALNCSFDNEHEFNAMAYDIEWMRESLIGSSIGLVDNPQAVGFFRHLWPEFLKQLQANAGESVVAPVIS